MLDTSNSLFGYNLCPTAGNSKGFKHSTKTKKWLSKFKRDHPASKETCEKIRQWHLGRKFSDMARSKISLGLIGKAKSSAHKASISKAKSKPIYQLDLLGNVIKKWDSVTKAQEVLKCSNISKCALGKGRVKTVKNSKWSYEINNTKGV